MTPQATRVMEIARALRQRTVVVIVALGEPEPGTSALDKRRQREEEASGRRRTWAEPCTAAGRTDVAASAGGGSLAVQQP